METRTITDATEIAHALSLLPSYLADAKTKAIESGSPLVQQDWPYDCAAKKENPTHVVYACDGAWWNGPAMEVAA